MIFTELGADLDGRTVADALLTKVTKAQGAATVSAQFGPQHPEDILQVLPAAAPAISAPPTQYVQAGTEVSFKISAESVVPAVLSAIDVPAGATFDTASSEFDWSPMPNSKATMM